MHDVLPAIGRPLPANRPQDPEGRKVADPRVLPPVPAGPRYFEAGRRRSRPAGGHAGSSGSRGTSRSGSFSRRRLRDQVAKTSRAYRELKRTQEQLVRSEKFASVGMLISDVAHELNNPLNVMYGNLKLLARRAAILGSAARPDARGRRASRPSGPGRSWRSSALRPGRPDGGVRGPDDCLQEALTACPAAPPQVALSSRRAGFPKVRCIPTRSASLPEPDRNASRPSTGHRPITSRTRLGRAGGRGDRGHGPRDPAGLPERLFEPFRTTEAVGQGHGAGLAIGAMILDRHSGSLPTAAPGRRSVFRSRSAAGSTTSSDMNSATSASSPPRSRPVSRMWPTMMSRS
jgi:hypothetical protein